MAATGDPLPAPPAGQVPLDVLRWGVDAPLPERRMLRAGPLTATLEGVTLRYVTVAGRELVRGLYAAVRDRNWGTPQPRFTRYDVEASADTFAVRFTAEHVDPAMDVDFVWDGTIDGAADGSICYTLDGVARRAFWRNRIGFCLLHAADLAGSPIEVLTPRGPVEGVFPERISPHQPFFEITGFRQRVSDEQALEIRFEGDLFEMEDQRNWTDASYKTYCTPLGLPYPVEIKQGERAQQSVTLRVVPRGPRERSAPLGPGGRATEHRQAPASGSASAGARTAITIADRMGGHLPAIGLGVASHGHALTEQEVTALRALHPAHLRVTVDLGRERWRETLSQAAREAVALGAAIELVAVAACETGGCLPQLAEALQAEERTRITRALVFPHGGVVTTEPVLVQARRAFAEAGLAVPLGGGTRADFVSLNRAAAAGLLPVSQMDVMGYAINPQVHTFDNASIVETLAAQGMTVRDARQIGQGKPVVVGPVTLKQRLNPAATAPDPSVAAGALPTGADPRQMSLFAAAWTVGSLRHLAEAGADALTYFETTGKLGVMEQSDASGYAYHPPFPAPAGMRFPVYHVLAAVASFRQAAGDAPVEVLGVQTSAPLAGDALALRAGGRVLLLVANLTGELQNVAVSPRGNGRFQIDVLDEQSALDPAAAPDGFRRDSAADANQATGADQAGAIAGRQLRLELLPYAVARLRSAAG